MFEDRVVMVTTETHQSQDLRVPPQGQNTDQNQDQEQDQDQDQDQDQASPSSLLAGFDPETMSQGPVNAITVLTLLDKLVNMLDAVQENQNKMEVHQVEMEGVVRGIQADMTKLSKSHSHTSNTVSKLLDKSRKLSVTMKEVRDKMERQGVQVKKLEANHAHLINRNNFKVLIFQEENEIPSTVFVKDPPPFPRDEIIEEGIELVPGVVDGNRSQESGLQTIDLSSDEDVGLEAELEEEEFWPHDLENMEKSRAEKLKRSSLKKVDSLKKAFSRQNIEKKMTKIGTKIVSQEQREKIKQKTSSLKVSPLTFNIRKPRSSSDSQPPDTSIQTPDISIQTPEISIQTPDISIQTPDISIQTGESVLTEADIQLSPMGSTDQEVPFTEVHAQLAPVEQEEKQEEGGEEVTGVEAELSVVSEEVSQEYALSSTLPQEEKGEKEGAKEERQDES
ncbi:caveolae-associated protein 2b [Labrus mixtus]|uniref:caveolae-associated protein 2b n=1 Tax=Labrus mixtus TaxID=508554 RepID=UPI0029C04734|nr:caveolae-associated protein 2b [Labrus mixtus]XP_060888205.1 caveolae-associated protein 2b [Labrus mixtus]XP_060888206.1 caveolae-associated protein 2b [Labrus mixtus]XP_060888207.1 caveolae-associated protein 2b [Labrus mixtus]XP_060888208.1 caveolae-associated protein 2b [Labrus mixtus]XP_060888210.1 caveolae-associated protein 2b [Labrus mixtus]XP_060888211.1 caveolae-associated protein 2b [Labrus mixtus]XP_060888212.1 caveolae-associated protein 2b [Labrus mixtus]